EVTSNQSRSRVLANSFRVVAMANESSASPTNALIRIHLHLGMQLIDALKESYAMSRICA
ncbi:MAG: hypothetical protein O6918_00735, partial [Deltaproteobacteria bacterium]|nr:hypothetical protein [Deltaproteobacteria bacterium]